MKIKMLGSLFIVQFLTVIVNGQCWSNSTCACHCVDCNTTCTECLPRWSGSTNNKCQRANTLYQGHVENDMNYQTLDGDVNTSVKVSYVHPYVRVKLKKSTEIDRIHITLQLRKFFLNMNLFLRPNS
ncbi:uncharacterized protein LOC133203359 [Saccostrea echinata]|uniref:uncharacterized protein LOC133203359 n=1 Tax=Saccostrea echinata TaxID=191078 RepID=UPI002A7F05A8|nr:uncharacterized protein LOC133203359 [Saccostrea echinata]